jgi:hypothetical protein
MGMQALDRHPALSPPIVIWINLFKQRQSFLSFPPNVGSALYSSLFPLSFSQLHTHFKMHITQEESKKEVLVQDETGGIERHWNWPTPPGSIQEKNAAESKKSWQNSRTD